MEAREVTDGPLSGEVERGGATRGAILAVASYARCRAEVHDGRVRGCYCEDIARRVQERGR